MATRFDKDPGPKPVFISYARSTNARQARALYDALGGEDGSAFLDQKLVPHGDQFPVVLTSAILNSRVFVLFADDLYFQRWICLRELQIALAPFEIEARKTQQRSQRQAALQHIVVALPNDGSTNCLENLPADLRMRNWPASSETTALVALVQRRLGQCASTFGQLLVGEDSQSFREALLSEAALPPPRPLPLPHYPVAFPPSLNQRFVGRVDDLFRIHFAISTLRGEANRTAALSGSVEAGGGFGKTCLVLEYAWRFGATHYPGGVFWLTADQDESGLEFQFGAMLSALRDKLPEPRLHEGNIRAELAAAFEAAAVGGKPILFIVDNLPEPRPGAETHSLEHYCPAMGVVTVLATTRARLLETRVRSVFIDPLARAASVSLLTDGTNLRPSLENSEWEEIAGWAGDLPLALDVLNSSLKLGAISPAELLARSRSVSVTKELSRQMSALQHQIAPGALRGITSALALSFDALSPEAKRAARLLSWFGSEPLPLELFHALGPGIDNAAVRAALIGHSILASFGNHADGQESLGTMHRVTADYIRNRVRTPRRDLALICDAFASVMTPERILNTNQWSLMNACLPHAARFFWGAMAETHQDGPPSASLTALFNRAAQPFTLEVVERLRYLADVCRQVLYDQYRYDTALQYAEAEYRLCSRKWGAESAPALESLVSVADVIRMTGDVDSALRMEEDVLPKIERLLGRNHPSTLLLMQNISVTLNKRGDHEKAKVLATRAFDAKMAILGPDHPETLSCQVVLARIASEADDSQNARVQYEAVYKAITRMVGPDSNKTFAARHGLAATLYDLGDYPAALEHMNELAAAEKRLMGPDHPSTLTSQHWTGIILAALGNYEKAEVVYRDVLRSRQVRHGSDADETLTTQLQLASCLDSRAKYVEAQYLREAVLEARRRRASGSENAKTLAAQAHLADCLQDLGRYSEAQPVYEKTVEGRRRVLGCDHPDTLWSQDHLGDNLVAKGLYDKAASAYCEGLERARRALGPESKQALMLQADLAECLEAMGRYEEARSCYERTLEISTRRLGATSRTALAAMNGLGGVLIALGDVGKARASLHSALEARLAIWGPDHIYAANSYQNWAKLLDAEGGTGGASEYFSKSLAIRQIKLRYRHYRTTICAWDLSETLRRLVDPKAAQVFREDLVWLVDARPKDLHAKQLEIRERLLARQAPSASSPGD